MGVINATPDSFSDGGRYLDPERAIEHALSLVAEGAVIIDVGGESTRPGSEPVSVTEEIGRISPIVEALSREGIPVSVDTWKPAVAEAGLALGAEIVNDVRACREPGMTELVADARCGLVLMHMQGTPKDMQEDPRYDDVVSEVEEFLVGRMGHVIEAGLPASRVSIDPGIGFGKDLGHNLALLRGLSRLARHAPVVLGASRKRFLGVITGLDEPADRDLATAVTTALGFLNGARVFRVHDVAKSRQALAVAAAMVRG